MKQLFAVPEFERPDVQNDFGQLSFGFYVLDQDVSLSRTCGLEEFDGNLITKLIVTCYYSRDDQKPYAFRVEYRPFSVNLDQAKEMLKTLTKIQKFQDKIDQEWGTTSDFATFCLRVFKALKCAGIARYQRDYHSYTILDLTSVATIIASELDQVKEKFPILKGTQS